MRATFRVSVKLIANAEKAVTNGYKYLGFEGVGDLVYRTTDEVASRASENAEAAVDGMGEYVHPFMAAYPPLKGVVVNNHPAGLSAEFGSSRRSASAPLRRALD